MTKKHFIALAQAIKAHNQEAEIPFDLQHVDTLANVFKNFNPAFLRSKFINDCGFYPANLHTP